MAVKAFRQCAKALREPLPYYIPVVREAKGLANLTLGGLEYLTGKCMKCYSDSEYYRKESARHLDLGTKTLTLGAQEFFPGAAIFASVALAYLNWDTRTELYDRELIDINFDMP
jgi:hypothetical protein